MPNLNHGIISQIPVSLPPATVWDCIIEAFDDVHAAAERLGARTEQAQEIKKVLLATAIGEAGNV